MPDFKFTPEEAAAMAAWLNASADAPKESTAPTAAAVLERGQRLVQTSGCLECHGLKLPNQFAAAPLAALTVDKWNRGCLAGAPDAAGKAPQFAFTADERAALQAFAATDRLSLTRHVPVEFAERETRLLNCRECHGKFEGFPAFEVLGGKLKPEWSQAFISGQITNQIRTLLEARMPAFPQWAEGIARGLAMSRGYPPYTPSKPPIDLEKAQVGRKLAGTDGGLSCVTCHAVAAAPAIQAEVSGINLALTESRLLKPYFQRWVRQPQAIDPATKMPLYFDEEGKSPLTEIYGGDGARQIEALWQYIRLGDKMTPPPKP